MWAMYKEVSAIALRAAGCEGFALGGADASKAHGCIPMSTAGVDLIMDRDGTVRDADALIAGSLAREGFTIWTAEAASTLGGLSPSLAASSPAAGSSRRANAGTDL